MNEKRIRSTAAIVGFSLMCGGIALMSVPCALAIGGVVVLFVAVVGELRA